MNTVPRRRTSIVALVREILTKIFLTKKIHPGGALCCLTWPHPVPQERGVAMRGGAELRTFKIVKIRAEREHCQDSELRGNIVKIHRQSCRVRENNIQRKTQKASSNLKGKL